jgi:tRNA nucleotidyltransferase/poly(A) polymerase
MSTLRQPDLFILDEQFELFEDRPSQGVSADPEEVRAEMNALLAELRAAKTMPWTEDDVGFYQVVFPQMSNWLPDDEAAQLCLEFEAEMARLKAA